MSAPRVLVSGVVLGQPIGGVVRHNAELLPRVAERLRRDGGGLAVLAGRAPIRFALPSPIERLASDVPASPAWRRALAEPRAVARALAAARAEGRPFDLVHFGHQPVPRRLAAPYTLTIHDLRDLDDPAAPAFRRSAARHVLARSIRGAARVFTVSAATRERIVHHFAASPDAIDVVSNAAPSGDPLPRDPARPPYLFVAGHVEPRKNLALIVEALALDPSLPPVVLAGASKRGERERLAALASRLGVAARVRFLGAIADEELRRHYARAAAVVLPARIEGFGIVALEAMRAGVPLAVSAIPAHLEVTAGLSPAFAPDDARGCGESIRRALALDAAALESARAAARRFDWDASADAWVAGWSRALAASRRGD